MMAAALPAIDAAARAEHLRWALALTTLPTAAGREAAPIQWIERWAAEREGVRPARDAFGNMTLSLEGARPSATPVYLTAHLDHPAFVVERAGADGVLELAFRGGVMDDYFADAELEVMGSRGSLGARVEGKAAGDGLFPIWRARLDDAGAASAVRAGDIARWRLPPPEIAPVEGEPCLMTHACDDLAAAAAALAALDVLRQRSRGGGGGARAGAGDAPPDVRVLFTRAEEIGFIGAIGACRERTVEPGARVIALENSRSFAESPIGGGPIVRVGDRISVFTPWLTAEVARVAEAIAGSPAEPTASQKRDQLGPWRWQRKLMAGGACEASVFCAYGLASTCVCLPLGNYHNMADLSAVQAGTNTAQPRVAREYVAVRDFEGLVDLLVGCGLWLGEGEPAAATALASRLDSLWSSRSFVVTRSKDGSEGRGGAAERGH